MSVMAQDILVDGHLDIAWNHFNHGRDFLQSAWARRRQETDPAFIERHGRIMVGLPELLLGRVAVVCASIFVAPAWSRGAALTTRALMLGSSPP